MLASRPCCKVLAVVPSKRIGTNLSSIEIGTNTMLSTKPTNTLSLSLHQPQRCLLSYKNNGPPSGEKDEKPNKHKFHYTDQESSNSSSSSSTSTNNNHNIVKSLQYNRENRHNNNTTKKRLERQTPTQRFKNPRRKEWSKQKQQQTSVSVIQPTQFIYKRRKHPRQDYNHRPDDDPTNPATSSHVSSSSSSASTTSSSASSSSSSSILKSLDASALLNPRAYCAQSAISTQTHNVTRSINGTDAARRLLRGKKDLILSARPLINTYPVLLLGHTVPIQLLQHMIDFGDACLRHYGPNTVECSFHNFHQENYRVNSSSSNSSDVSLPLHVRIRQQDSTNACLPPPSAYDSRIYDNIEIDWDYHLELYLTVVGKMADGLGQIFDYSPSPITNQKKKQNEEDMSSTTIRNEKSPRSGLPPPIEEYQFDNDDEHDFMVSPLLFPSPRPRWNVEICRGLYYDISPIAGLENVEQQEQEVTGNIPPPPPISPIIEFVQESSKSSGHVLIRIQGTAMPNPYFDTTLEQQQQQQQRRPPQPVTLVFDAGYYKKSALAFQQDF